MTYLNLPTLGKTDFSLVSLPFACCTEVGRSIEVVSVENKKIRQSFSYPSFINFLILYLIRFWIKQLQFPKNCLLTPYNSEICVSSTYLVACLKMRFHFFFLSRL